MFGQSQDVHTFHHLGMWYIIVFVIFHVYVVIREDIMSRQSMVSSMIFGWRIFKDHRGWKESKELCDDGDDKD